MAAILVVDADPDQIRAVRFTLEPLGHAVLLAATAERATETLRDGGIDLVLMHYADSRQLDVFARGLERLPDPPPFVLVSGSVDAPTQSAHYGAAEFLARPWQAEELVALVRRVLEERHAPSEFEDTPTRPNERRAGGTFEE